MSKGYPNHYNAWHESEYYPDYFNMWRESEYYEVNVSVILLYVHKRCISMYIVNVILNQNFCRNGNWGGLTEEK